MVNLLKVLIYYNFKNKKIPDGTQSCANKQTALAGQTASFRIAVDSTVKCWQIFYGAFYGVFAWFHGINPTILRHSYEYNLASYHVRYAE